MELWIPGQVASLPGQEEANVLHVSSQNEDRTVKTAWTALAPLKQWDAAVLEFNTVLPENTGERIHSLVMDKQQVR